MAPAPTTALAPGLARKVNKVHTSQGRRQRGLFLGLIGMTRLLIWGWSNHLEFFCTSYDT